MRTDISNWMPITVPEIKKVFSDMPLHWCIAGGWALDLHLCKQTREHSDIDVIITRDEQLIAYQNLKRDWMLYKAQDGILGRWRVFELYRRHLG
ncbi:hypothetical protein RB297_24420 [Paenibacillus sp. CR_12]